MPRLRINEVERARWFVFAFTVVSAIVALAISVIQPPSGLLYTSIHLNAIRLSVVLYALIFAVAWDTHRNTLPAGIVLLACVFLCSSILDFFYLNTGFGLPPFVSEKDTDKSVYFWLLARAGIAFGVLAAALQQIDATISRRGSIIAIATALAIVGAISYAIFLDWDYLPRLIGHDNKPTFVKIAFDYGSLAAGAAALALLYVRMHAAEDKNGKPDFSLDRINLFAATLAMTAAQACFVLFTQPAFITKLLDPLYTIVAGLFFYRSVVTSSIKTPYAELSDLAEHLQATTAALKQSELRLAGIIQNATDAIITTDESQRIVLANPSAASMFGTTVKEMQGSPLEKYIPPRHRKEYRKYIERVGKVQIPFFKTGKSYVNYDVTGLRANGEEFHVETSISSMTEKNGQLYTLILRDITDQKKAQEELARSHAELARLSAALQSVREEERRNIARDLHDDLGQLLATLRIDLSLLQRQAMEFAISPRQLVNMDEVLATSISSLRRIAADLRPRALDEGGLYFAVQMLRKEFVSRHGIACELIADENELVLDDQRSTAIFRIVQESLANVFRHAQAKKVVIEFKCDCTNLEISIRDDGRGIRAEDLQKDISFGLVGMRERVHAMNGAITISSEENRGTQIHIILPI
jgi:PAS domain S-box-containing protein